MLARRAAGIKLITEAIAVEIARLVLTEEHGEDELKRQLPLMTRVEGNTWVVRGSQAVVETLDMSKYRGPFEIRISQLTGQIFGCCVLYYFPREPTV